MTENAMERLARARAAEAELCWEAADIIEEQRVKIAAQEEMIEKLLRVLKAASAYRKAKINVRRDGVIPVSISLEFIRATDAAKADPLIAGRMK